jgi:hypothetical protein
LQLELISASGAPEASFLKPGVGANFSVGAVLRRREIFRRRENSFKKLASVIGTALSIVGYVGSFDVPLNHFPITSNR